MPDSAHPAHSLPEKAEIVCSLILLAAVPGYVAGIGTWLVLWLVDRLQALIWDSAAAGLPPLARTLSPIALCLAGGIVVGLWTRHCGYELDTMASVIVHCRKEGGYRIRNWKQALGLFFAPIVFGGSVGPEAGISGFAAAAFSSVLRRIRIGGAGALDGEGHPLSDAVRALAEADDEDEAAQAGRTRLQELSHWKTAKALLWALAGLAFAYGCLTVTKLLGPAGEMPRFAAVPYATADWAAGLIALAAGYVAALFGDLCQKAAGKLSGALGADPLIRAVVCGLVLGVCACLMPLVLFSGQSGITSLMESWESWAPTALILLAACKLFLTKLCVASSWVGGEFFPTIFCGVALGYAIALLAGAEPLLPIALATSGIVAAWTRKPLLTTAVLALCFPPQTLPCVLVSSWIAAKLPHPASKAGK